MTSDQFQRIFYRVHSHEGLKRDLRIITLENFHALLGIVEEELASPRPRTRQEGLA